MFSREDLGYIPKTSKRTYDLPAVYEVSPGRLSTTQPSAKKVSCQALKTENQTQNVRTGLARKSIAA